jgi:ACS family hexuronate transporter-like MFS transporter
MASRDSERWWAVGVFTLYSALNYLDRQTLAALGPQLRTEFGLSNQAYGWLASAFYIAYALCSPVVGLLIDRVGLSLGAMMTLAVWSMAGVATGLTQGFAGLLACRVVLGIAEAGGIPAYSKATATYLKPEERSFGAGLNQIGLSVGTMGAPLLAASVGAVWGWRMAFVVAGALGLLWIPLWKVTEAWVRRPAPAAAARRDATPARMLADRSLWGLVLANMLVMTCYGLWIQWTTLFLVDRYGLTPDDVNQRLAWIPPIFATLGGLAGGWIVWKWSTAGKRVRDARMHIMLLSALCVVATALTPRMPSAEAAVAVISFSFFWTVAMSANLYAIPQDLFGADRAAFALSAITSGFGAMQTVFQPFTGWLVDQYGFEPVCWIAAVTPLAGWLVLRLTERAD